VHHFSILSHEGLLKFAHPKPSLYCAMFQVFTVMLLRVHVLWGMMLYCSEKMGLLASEGEGTTVL
jgi:hypothetical protein